MNKKNALKIWLVVIVMISSTILFGKQNLIIGIAGFLLIPAITIGDYKYERKASMLKLFFSYLVLGIGATLFHIETFLGVILTALVTAYIYYFYSYEDRESKAINFMFYYIIIFAFPIGAQSLLWRVLAVIYVSFISVILYYIIYRMKMLNDTEGLFLKLFGVMNIAIRAKIRGKEYERIIDRGESLIQEIDASIVRKINKGVYGKATYKKEIYLKLIREYMYAIREADDLWSLKELTSLVDFLKKLYIKKTSLAKFTTYLELKNYSNINSVFLRLDVHLKIFLREMSLVNEKKAYHYNHEKIDEVAKKYTKEFYLDYGFIKNIKSIKSNIALKGLILMTGLTFVIYILQLSNGRWLLFGAICGYIPLHGFKIGKLRRSLVLIGIGFILLNVFFEFMPIHTNMEREIIAILIIISSYLAIYFINYSKKVIFVIFTIFEVEFLVSGLNYGEMYIEKILYVIIGIVIAYIVMRIFEPIKSSIILDRYYDSYIKLNDEIIKTFDKSIENDAGTMTVEEIEIVFRILSMRIKFLNRYCKSRGIEIVNNLEAKILEEFKIVSLINDPTFTFRYKGIYSLESFFENLEKVKETIIDVK
ncbi:MAG: hypothetical protein ACRCYE_05140 [Sarcina sp.]